MPPTMLHYLKSWRQRLRRWLCATPGLRLLCRACFSLEAGEESGPECDCYGVGRAKGSAAWKQMVALFFFFQVLGGRQDLHALE